MRIQSFKLERYFAEYEFKVKFLLSPSDCESLRLSELLEMATPESYGLWQNLRLGYTESQGHPALLDEISHCYQNILPDQVLIAAPEEAIFVAMNCLLQPGNQVIAISPAYQSLYEIANAINCEVVNWPLVPDNKNWKIDLNWLEDNLSQKTRMIVINFPHNPTGYLPTQEEFQSIINMADRYGTILFSDEMYRGLEYNDAQRLSSASDCYDRAVSLAGLSKSYALPGLRIGWLSTKQIDWIAEWLRFKDYTTICNSAPSEILAIIALQNKERLRSRNRQIIQQNLVYAENFFNEHPDEFTWFAPQAGSVAFPLWRGNSTIERFCQDLLKDQGVMIVPGSIFDFQGSHFRVGLGRNNFPEALDRVGKFLELQK